MGGYATRAIHPRPERRGFPRSPDKDILLVVENGNLDGATAPGAFVLAQIPVFS